MNKLLFVLASLLLLTLLNARITIPITRRYITDPLPEYNNGIAEAFLRADDEPTPIIYHPFNVTVMNSRNFFFFGQLYVGKNNTAFNVLLDTGSNDLWLPTTECQECPAKTKYACSESSTCQLTNVSIQMPYGIGFVEGLVGVEFVGFSKDLKIKAPLVFVSSGKDLQNYKDVDGFMGLGNMEAALDFIDLAYKAGRIEDKVFSFYLDHNYANDTYTNGSYLAIGYIPEEKVNKVTWVPVTNPNRWATEIKEMKVGDKVVDLTPDANNTKDILIDSGFSLLLLSDLIIVELYNQLADAEKVMFMDIAPAYRCDYGYPEKYPNITVSVNGMDLVLTAYNYLVFSQIVQQDGKNYCLLGFMRASLGMQILGASFLKTNFVTFSKRNQTMGIHQEFTPIILPPAPKPEPKPDPTPTPIPEPKKYYYSLGIIGVVVVLIMGLAYMKNKKGARKLEKTLGQDQAYDYYNAQI